MTAAGVEAFDIARDLVLLGRRMQEYGAAVIQGNAHPVTALHLAEAMEQLAQAMRTPIPDEPPPDPGMAALALAASEETAMGKHRDESNARHIARDAEDGLGTVMDRQKDGEWTSGPVGRGDAEWCERLPK